MTERICIDCSPLLVRSAGVKTYLHHWLRALRHVAGNSITAFLDPGDDALQHGASMSENFPQLGLLCALNRLGPGAISAVAPDCDVFHASNLLRHVPRKRVLSATIHDLTTRLLPRFHTAEQRAADDRFADSTLRPARGLICVSAHTKSDAERELGIDPERIRVIYPGVAASFFRARPPKSERPYFLFVSTIEPRKNLDGLLSAWLDLPRDFRHAHELVVAGMPGWKSDATMARLREIENRESGVRYLGYVDEAILPGLTAGAMALVYPSFYEGFGIPVAQAMAAGCPVIVSGVSSLPEVAGDSGLLFDPSSTSEIAAALRRVAESESLRIQMSERGRERARMFTWERAARESLDYFENLLSS